MNVTGTSAETLQKVNLPVINNEVCSSWYESQGKHVVISSRQFCAGYKEGGKDACRVWELFFNTFFTFPRSLPSVPMLYLLFLASLHQLLLFLDTVISCRRVAPNDDDACP